MRTIARPSRAPKSAARIVGVLDEELAVDAELVARG